MKIPAFFWVVPACIALTGCNAIIGKIFLGIDKPRVESLESQNRYLNRLGIKADHLSILSDSAFKEMGRQSYKTGFAEGFRPIQIRIFDTESRLLKWQYSICEGQSESFFSTFPPTNIWPVKDSLWTLKEELDFLHNPMDARSSSEIESMGKGIVMVVYWAKYLGKPSKRLLKAANDFHKDHVDTYLILANIGCPVD